MHDLAQQPTTKYSGVGPSYFTIYLESEKLGMVVNCLKIYRHVFVYTTGFLSGIIKATIKYRGLVFLCNLCHILRKEIRKSM